MDKLTNSKILAADVRDLKKIPSEEHTFEDIAKLVTNKLDERAVVERTKLQKADHTKQLLDQLNGGKPKETKKAAAAAKKAAAAGDDASKETKANKKNSELTAEEKKEKRKAQTLKKKGR